MPKRGKNRTCTNFCFFYYIQRIYILLSLRKRSNINNNYQYVNFYVFPILSPSDPKRTFLGRGILEPFESDFCVIYQKSPRSKELYVGKFCFLTFFHKTLWISRNSHFNSGFFNHDFTKKRHITMCHFCYKKSANPHS